MPKVSGMRVVRSSIHGYGVVATRTFAEGEEICAIDGVAWKDGDGVDDRYSLWIEDGVYFDMVDQTRYINHSCEPNAEVWTGFTPTASRGPRSSLRNRSRLARSSPTTTRFRSTSRSHANVAVNDAAASSSTKTRYRLLA